MSNKELQYKPGNWFDPDYWLLIKIATYGEFPLPLDRGNTPTELVERLKQVDRKYIH